MVCVCCFRYLYDKEIQHYRKSSCSSGIMHLKAYQMMRDCTTVCNTERLHCATLASFHSCIFCHDNCKLKSRNTAFLLQNSPPGMYASFLAGALSACVAASWAWFNLNEIPISTNKKKHCVSPDSASVLTCRGGIVTSSGTFQQKWLIFQRESLAKASY